MRIRRCWDASKLMKRSCSWSWVVRSFLRMGFDMLRRRALMFSRVSSAGSSGGERCGSGGAVVRRS